MPEHLEVDLSVITNFDVTLTAADIALPEGVTLVDVPDTLLVKVTPPRLLLDEDEEEEGRTTDAAADAASDSDADADSE